MRVLVADDNHEVRSALRLFLEEDPKLLVVAEAKDLEEIDRRIADSRPSLLIVDWQMLKPLVETEDSFKRRWPGLAVIVTSSQPGLGRQALEAGAVAFVCKGDPPETVRAAVAAARRELQSDSLLPSADRPANMRPMGLSVCAERSV